MDDDDHWISSRSGHATPILFRGMQVQPIGDVFMPGITVLKSNEKRSPMGDSRDTNKISRKVRPYFKDWSSQLQHGVV